jgi:hypothetical protein
LSDPAFLAKAPPAVVDKEKARAGDLRAAIARLEEQAGRIKALSD